MPKFPEKNTQGEDTSKLEVKKVKDEIKPWDAYFVPKEQLSVKVSQHVWSQLGIFSRQRLLKEHPTNVGEKCFACQREGRRSYYCDTMITVAQRLSSFFNQPSGGQRVGQTVFCVLDLSTRESGSLESGWWVGTVWGSWVGCGSFENGKSFLIS